MITLVISIAILTLSFYDIIYLIYTRLVATPFDIIERITTLNSYVSVTFELMCGLLLGSSNVPEKTLTHLLGAGVINLEQRPPWSLGSNVGFSVSTILISLSTNKEGFVQVILSNCLFYAIRIRFWFIFPVIRIFPLQGALMFGILSNNLQFSLIYDDITFFVIPFLFISIIQLTQNISTIIKADGFIALSLLEIICFCVQY